METPEDIVISRDVLAALRAFAALGWIAPFGHVSVRHGARALISATLPPVVQREESLVPIALDGSCDPGRLPDRPIEAFLHAAIYRARADVGAICRAHPPAASAWAAGSAIPPLAVGLGGFALRLARYPDPDLVHDAATGDAVADWLAQADGVFLQANGVVTVGRNMAEAAARMWSLEQRCIAASSGVALLELTPQQVVGRARWFDREIARTWAWLQTLANQ